MNLKENEVRESLKVNTDEVGNLKKDIAIAKRVIAKVANLGISNSEAESKSFKELESEGEAKIHELTDLAKKATDDTLKVELTNVKNKNIELEQKLTKEKETWESKIKETEIKFQNDLKAKDNNIWLKEKFADPKTKLRDPAFKRIIEQDVLTDIKDLVKGDDGVLKTKDGLYATIIVEGKPVVVNSEDEVFEHRLKPYLPVDGNGGGSDGKVNIQQNNQNKNQYVDQRLEDQNRINAERVAAMQLQ